VPRSLRGRRVAAIAQTLAKERGITKVITDLPTDSVVEPPAIRTWRRRGVTQKIVEALR